MPGIGHNNSACCWSGALGANLIRYQVFDPGIVAVNILPLQWRHNGCDGVSNHQSHDCLLNRLFRCRSKKTSKLRVTGLCVGIHRWPVNSPHKGPVTRKMFPFDDVIMRLQNNNEYSGGTNWVHEDVADDALKALVTRRVLISNKMSDHNSFKVSHDVSKPRDSCFELSYM